MTELIRNRSLPLGPLRDRMRCPQALCTAPIDHHHDLGPVTFDTRTLSQTPKRSHANQRVTEEMDRCTTALLLYKAYNQLYYFLDLHVSSVQRSLV